MTPVSLTHSRKERTKPNLGDLKISKSFDPDCRRWDPAQTPTALQGLSLTCTPTRENPHVAPTQQSSFSVKSRIEESH